MIVGAIVILLLAAWLDIEMRAIGRARAAEHQHTFTEYVQTHHLGTLVTIDDGTGIDPVSYLLNLSHPVADKQREALALQLMKIYATEDHGQLLTIAFIDPRTKVSEPVAEADLNDESNTLQLTVHFTNGTERVTTRHVQW